MGGPVGFPTAHSAVATADRSNPIQIKICGVTNANDARACVELGADMIGFNFYPASPRYIEPTIVRGIVDALPARTCAVGVFVDADPAEIRKLAKTAGVRCVQLHGHTTPESCSELAREFRVIRALSTDTRFEPEHTAAFPECDVLIDAYHPELRGGTGQTCDWSAARAAMRYTRFLILSGGLDAQNVGRAIAAVTPHAVDVCSGVESAPGVKDHRALEQFISAVRAAERSLHASTHKPPAQCHPERSEGSRINSATDEAHVQETRDVSLRSIRQQDESAWRHDSAIYDHKERTGRARTLGQIRWPLRSGNIGRAARGADQRVHARATRPEFLARTQPAAARLRWPTNTIVSRAAADCTRRWRTNLSEARRPFAHRRAQDQ